MRAHRETVPGEVAWHYVDDESAVLDRYADAFPREEVNELTDCSTSAAFTRGRPTRSAGAEAATAACSPARGPRTAAAPGFTSFGDGLIPTASRATAARKTRRASRASRPT
jgi:hypothetical protein